MSFLKVYDFLCDHEDHLLYHKLSCKQDINMFLIRMAYIFNTIIPIINQFLIEQLYAFMILIDEYFFHLIM